MFSCNSLILQFLLQIQSREIHVLCVRSRLHAGASTVLSAEFNQIITRLESSHTHPEDVILNTSKESSSPPTNTCRQIPQTMVYLIYRFWKVQIVSPKLLYLL